MTPAGVGGRARCLLASYWISLNDAGRWLDNRAVEVISPLDSMNATELELSEEQENWLRWLVENEVQRVRVE